MTVGSVAVTVVAPASTGRVWAVALVVSVVALAPWLPADEPVVQLRGRRVLIAHGSLDMVTSPRASRRFAARAATAGVDVTYRPIAGEMHAMLFRWQLWHHLATQFSLDALSLVR